MTERKRSQIVTTSPKRNDDGGAIILRGLRGSEDKKKE
jgi:hypothetical protein